MGNYILSATRLMLNSDDQYKILDGGVDDIYNWFFDIPSYKSSLLKSFFCYLSDTHSGLENFFVKIEWHVFEHVLYTYYRRISEGVNINSYNGFGIDYGPETLKALHRSRLYTLTGYKSLWHLAENHFQEGLQSVALRPYFLFHIDRLYR